MKKESINENNGASPEDALDETTTHEDTPRKAVDDAPVTRDASPLTAMAGVLLLLAALFAVAAVVAFGSLGRNSPWFWAFAALGLLSLAGWFVGRRGADRLVTGDAYSRQRSLLGVNAITSVLLLLALLVGINYLAARRNKTFDLTQNQANLLAPQSLNALKQLDGTVTMTYVYAITRENPQIDLAHTRLLDSYKYASNHVRVEYINALDPSQYSQMPPGTNTNFTGQPLLVLQMPQTAKTATKGTTPMAGNLQEVLTIDEQSVTSALLKLKDATPRVLYFLTGHGELDPTKPAQPGMSQAQIALQNQNYTIKTLGLLRGKSGLPADAAAIIAVGPTGDLTAEEEKVLQQYVTNKGRFVLMLVPIGAKLPRWNNVLKRMGMQWLDGVVLDPTLIEPQVMEGDVGDRTRHPLLQGVNKNVLMPAAAPLRLEPAPPAGLNATPIFETTENSVRQAMSNSPTAPNAAQRGPFVLAATVQKGTPPPPGAPPGTPPETDEKGTRAVVIANTYFAIDQFFDLVGNRSFFLAAINWTAGNEALVSIPPKPPATNTLTDMTPPLRLFAILLGIFVLPILALLTGTVVWWKRR